MVNNTYGTLDEIRELWDAIRGNVILNYVDGEMAGEVVYFDSLDAYGMLNALLDVHEGYARVEIDGDGLIYDLFMNLLVDHMIGAMSKADRAALEAAGIRGIFDAGNATTWINRILRVQEAINRKNAEQNETQEENANGIQTKV